MANVAVYPVGDLRTNAYILSDRGEACIIDPAASGEVLAAAVGDNLLKYIILTHGHIDHFAALDDVVRDGCQISIHRLDLQLLAGNGDNAASNRSRSVAGRGNAFDPWGNGVVGHQHARTYSRQHLYYGRQVALYRRYALCGFCRANGSLRRRFLRSDEILTSIESAQRRLYYSLRTWT